MVSGPSDAVRRSSLGSSSSNGDNRGASGGGGCTMAVLTAQRSWWAEGVQAGMGAGAARRGRRRGAAVAAGGRFGARRLRLRADRRGRNIDTHSPHYYNQHVQGSNMAEETAGVRAAAPGGSSNTTSTATTTRHFSGAPLMRLPCSGTSG